MASSAGSRRTWAPASRSPTIRATPAGCDAGATCTRRVTEHACSVATPSSSQVDVRPLLGAVTWRMTIKDAAGATAADERHSTLLGRFLARDDLARSGGAPVAATPIGQRGCADAAAGRRHAVDRRGDGATSGRQPRRPRLPLGRPDLARDAGAVLETGALVLAERASRLACASDAAKSQIETGSATTAKRTSAPASPCHPSPTKRASAAPRTRTRSASPLRSAGATRGARTPGTARR